MPPGNAKLMMESVFRVAQRINQMRLSDAEIGLLCAIVIITPGKNWLAMKTVQETWKHVNFLIDRAGLRNQELLDQMQTKLKSVLSSILLPQHLDQVVIELHEYIALTKVIWFGLLNFRQISFPSWWQSSMISEPWTLYTLRSSCNNARFLERQEPRSYNDPRVIASSAIPSPPGRSTGTLPETAVLHRLMHSLLVVWKIAGKISTPAQNAILNIDLNENDDYFSNRRSPVESVSSTESIGPSDIHKLTTHDLRVNGSMLMNALIAPSSATCAALLMAAGSSTRQRLYTEDQCPSTSSMPSGSMSKTR